MMSGIGIGCFACALIIGGIIRHYLPSYLKEKAKNLATKEDLKTLTKISEEIKEEYKRKNDIQTKKYELKYTACMNALKIVDAQLSSMSFYDNDGKNKRIPDRQYANADEVRQCHNALILTCENAEIINSFTNLMLGSNDPKWNNLLELNIFRNLIRKELGFGEVTDLDKEKIWFSIVTCKKEVK